MADITPAQLAEWEALADAATPGPWEAMVYDSGLSYRALNAVVITEAHGDRVCEADYDGDAEGPRADEGCDAAFIAAAREAVPALIAALRQANEELAAIKRRV